MPQAPLHPRMIAMDLDGTLLGADGRVGQRNIAALRAAEDAGIVVAIATGRRHSYALPVLRDLGLHPDTLLVSSNGAVVRTFASALIERTLMTLDSALWLAGHLGDFRDALVITFDKVAPDGGMLGLHLCGWKPAERATYICVRQQAFLSRLCP